MENQQTTRDDWIDEILPGEEEIWKIEQTTFHAKGKDVLNLIKELLQKTNIVKISIWHHNRQLASIPVVYGGLVAVLFPFLSLFSMISLLALDCKVVVEKKT